MFSEEYYASFLGRSCWSSFRKWVLLHKLVNSTISVNQAIALPIKISKMSLLTFQKFYLKSVVKLSSTSCLWLQFCWWMLLFYARGSSTWWKLPTITRMMMKCTWVNTHKLAWMDLRRLRRLLNSWKWRIKMMRNHLKVLQLII